MPLPIYRLRRILGATAAVITVIVAGMYFYARWRTKDILHTIPGKIGIEYKQTANGFQYSKSDGKRTLFTIQASELKEFKLNGRAELHNVKIVLYGRDSSRYDQIAGDDFSYDPKTGDVVAKGEVQIDLVSNPAGLSSPDQSAPKELKNPIHLKTRDLVFNRESGNASTDALVEFRTAQATGSAIGVNYAGKTNVLTLGSQIHLILTGKQSGVIDAEHGTIINEPRLISLQNAQLHRERETLRADRAEFELGPDNNVRRIVATDHVEAESATAQNAGEPVTHIHAHADRAEFLLTDEDNLLRTGILTGNVHFEQTGTQTMEGDASRVVLDYSGHNELQTVHAMEGARLRQRGGPGVADSGAAKTPQDFELTAPAIDFRVGPRNVLENAITSGAAQMRITSQPQTSAASARPQQTVITAGRFEGVFATSGGKNRLASVHGTSPARIVNSSPGQPDRVSTSDVVDAAFLPQGGVESVTQTGNVVYSDGQTADKRTQAWARTAQYTPSDQMLVLSGSPRVSVGAMMTTANTVRVNRANGQAVAEGDVKTTYSDVKEQPDGALLASASPIHVSARSMTANNTGVALYTGNARLWQDANVIEAPSIRFDRDRRFVVAQGTSSQPVQTVLVQKEGQKASPKNADPSGGQASKKSAVESAGKPSLAASSPITITAAQLTYSDTERKAHYEGGVLAKGVDFEASAETLDAFLVPRSAANSASQGPGQLDHMVAQGNVVVQQPKRRAEGQQLVYTAAEDKFVLTGGPPSIFDAEQGKITGVSLTFFRHDDRVLVEGEASNSVVTTTRVAR